MINEKILTLSSFLRDNGMNISIRSTILASQVMEMYSYKFNSDEMKEALKCIYVKNKDDLPKYERLYNFVFVYNKNTFDNSLDHEHIQIDNKNVKKQDNRHTDTNKIKQEKKKVASDTTRETIIKRRLQHKEHVDKSVLDDEFTSLNSIDYRVYDICTDFSKKIANQRSIRKKSKKNKGVHIPRTIRKNLKNGGHLINLVGQKPPLHKSRHLFLCDISGSCEWATTWFFTLLTGCHKSFDKLEIYLFDNRIIDVTHALESSFKNTYQVNIGLQSLGLRPRCHSDMTKSFEEFLKEARLNKHTDVILLTDCRDWTGKREKGVLESATILNKIKIKSRKVIILNPEKKIRWNTPTSCVKDYEEIGASVHQTSTIKEFAKVIKEI
ncbi:VWA domain-containing protein [Methanosphaera sp. WGK6]|uniref:VWA domain-containing protein n=1 Tax=Methanosphaera sp. WGK6 TaxID=1561964 RepID=UPI00084C17AC|nr:VWA domain-containing protein [Methanosphaera sp. WGK6]OED30701.1 hypothetical protein NL43_01825 [Methanosphaera sp. WGK6]